MSYVPEQLRAKAALYEERNALYGDNYKKFGPIMELLGIKELKSASDHGRFAIFVQIVAKVTRYAENFHRGGHDDSLDDIAVYSMMLKELDQIETGKRSKEKPKGAWMPLTEEDKKRARAIIGLPV